MSEGMSESRRLGIIEDALRRRVRELDTAKRLPRGWSLGDFAAARAVLEDEARRVASYRAIAAQAEGRSPSGDAYAGNGVEVGPRLDLTNGAG